MDKELQINDLILLTIKRIGINGEGIGFYKRKAVFVQNVLPEEVVEVKITRIEEKYIEGTAVKFKKVSPNRIKPACDKFDTCGGCQLQHLAYNAQLVEKRNLVVETFEKYYDGDITKIKIYDTIGMDTPYNYRNKMSLPVRHDGEKVRVGLYAENSNKLVYVDNCLIDSELIRKAKDEILEVLTKEKVDVYNPKTKEGVLRYLIIRGFETTNEVQVTFVVTKYSKKLENVAKKLKFASVNYSINDDPKSIELMGREVNVLAGKEKITGKLQDLKFEISPKAFMQLNSQQTIQLYEAIKRVAKFNKDDKLLDCYCGIGSIGLYLANVVKEVRGIDNNKDAINDANDFATLNNIKNAKFYFGNVLPHLYQFAKENFVPDVLVVDPPRRGLELNIINYLKTNPIEKIIYVSCNPATLVKNLNHLKKEYRVVNVQPIDMFPQTASVETVVLLSKR